MWLVRVAIDSDHAVGRSSVVATNKGRVCIDPVRTLGISRSSAKLAVAFFAQPDGTIVGVNVRCRISNEDCKLRWRDWKVGVLRRRHICEAVGPEELMVCVEYWWIICCVWRRGELRQIIKLFTGSVSDIARDTYIPTLIVKFPEFLMEPVQTDDAEVVAALNVVDAFE